MEGKEWIWDNGVIKEAEISGIKKRLDVKTRHDRANLEALEFAKFLKKL